MKFKISMTGSSNYLEKFLKREQNNPHKDLLDAYGKKGLEALKRMTPVDSGRTVDSWGYTIDAGDKRSVINWNNSNINKGVNIAIILQYGHGTRNGGWVESRDYINPAIDEVFKGFANALWVEITKP